MRDRLIELLDYLREHPEKTCPHFNSKTMCRGCKYEELDDCYSSRKADYLIENGVIVPPCKVGDKVYVIKRCRCGKPENYDLKVCGRKITTKTPKVLARVMYQETGKRLKPNSWKIEYEVAPKGTICYSLYEKQFTLKMLTEIGKTVFLTREEAEAKLKEGAE